jgi:hypothetical protein
MNNIFFWLKLLGRNSVQTTIAKNLGTITDDGWKALASEFHAATDACAVKSKGDLAAALTEVLFGIK